MEWEYYTLKLKPKGIFSSKIEPEQVDGMLNEAGVQGWELVNVVSVNQGYGATGELLFFFKRPR